MTMTIHSRNQRSTILAAVLLAVTLVAAACSDGDDGGDIASVLDSTTSSAAGGDTSAGADGSTTTETTTADTPASDSTTSTTEAGSTTTVGDADLPGEVWDGFAQEGDVFSVFGVEADDELNIRAMPGTDNDIIGTAAPTADDLVATGRARQLPSSFWYEVSHGGITGWVSVAFVAYEGGTDDATAEFLAENGSASAETLQDLGRIVAQGFASVDPDSELVESIAPTVGDLGEVTYDVVGLGDDAGAGYRIHVFATEGESGETWELRTIERTSYCTRGVTGELCN